MFEYVCIQVYYQKTTGVVRRLQKYFNDNTVVAETEHDRATLFQYALRVIRRLAPGQGAFDWFASMWKQSKIDYLHQHDKKDRNFADICFE